MFSVVQLLADSLLVSKNSMDCQITSVHLRQAIHCDVDVVCSGGGHGYLICKSTTMYFESAMKCLKNLELYFQFDASLLLIPLQHFCHT